MKRLLGVVVLVVVFMMSVSLVTAEESKYDISGYTIEELLALKDQITASLLEKHGLHELPCGEYLVGRDIAPGSYQITFLKNKYGTGSTTVRIYTSADARVKYDSAYDDYKIRVTLVEEAIQNNSSVQIEVPEAFDASKYYVMNNEKYCYAGESTRIHLEDGQLLYISYSTEDFYAVIEKTQGLFME